MEVKIEQDGSCRCECSSDRQLLSHLNPPFLFHQSQSITSKLW